MNHPEKLAPWGTQDKDKQNKNVTQYVLDIAMLKQTHLKISRTYFSKNSDILTGINADITA
jgi:hypothetical protein